ncbi:MAG: MMPL family transporter [Myxococcales bacterium]|nr:MMPL family transporter [Myxococcales bacterium]
MNVLAAFIRRHNGAILLAALAISAVAASRLPPRYDDDVLQFLPKDDPEIARLEEIVKRFGGLNVALIGVEAEGSLFTTERLVYLRTLAQTLKTSPLVAFVTSLSEIAIVDAPEGGSPDGAGVHRPLLPETIPTDAAATQGIETDILSRDFLVGSLVSAKGTATRLIVQLRVADAGDASAPDLPSPTEAAASVRALAEGIATPAGVRLHFGGAPFIAEAAANGSQADLLRLGPWVCLVIILSIVLTLGRVRAAILCVAVVGLGILWTVGLMAWLGQPLTLLSSSLPVMLVALGSAFAVHILVWYLDNGGDVDDVLAKMGGPVILSAFAALAGFLSFLLMDLAPLRAFGWQMAVGSLILGAIAVIVVPAALLRFKIPANPPRNPATAGGFAGRLDAALGRLSATIATRRAPVLFVMVVVGAFATRNVFEVRTSMDTRSFFEPGSKPDQADQFMVDHFGGAVFLQVLVDGDMRDPGVLRTVAAFEDRLVRMPGVTHVESFTKVMALVNEGLTGKRVIARTRDGISQQSFLAEATDPAVKLLVDTGRTGTVIQVAIGAFDTEVVEKVTSEIVALASKAIPKAVVTVPRSADLQAGVVRDAAERILAVAGDAASMATAETVMRHLGAGGGLDAAALTPKVLVILKNEIEVEEMVLLKEGASLDPIAESVAKAIAAGHMNEAAFAKALEPVVDPSELEDRAIYAKGARYVWKRLEGLAKADAATPIARAITAELGELDTARRSRILAIVDDIVASEWVVDAALVPAAKDPKPLSLAISGYPMIQQAMTRSVHGNHIKSLAFSGPIVLFLLIIAFRSLRLGVIAAVPAGLTLALTYGLMGTFPEALPLDIAGSMLASIALGTGIDYAIHVLWRYREGGTEAAMRTTGRRVLINAVEVSLGFSVLGFATIVPMSRFGLLTAFTLAVAALVTLVVVPALLPRAKTESAP